MSCIIKNYAIKYELSFANNYVWLNDNSCYNLKTGRSIKQVYNSRCIGYNINGKFYSLTYLRNYLVKPRKEDFLS